MESFESKGIKKEAMVAEIKKETAARELELLKRREQDLLSQLEKVRLAMATKETELAFKKGESNLFEEERAEKGALEKHKEAIKKGEIKL